jgi:hypothetical protein
MAKPVSIEVWNPNGKYRVVSTKSMPGTRWINLLIQQDCRLEVISSLCLLFASFFLEIIVSKHCMCFLKFRYVPRRKQFFRLKISLLWLVISVMELLDRLVIIISHNINESNTSFLMLIIELLTNQNSSFFLSLKWFEMV